MRESNATIVYALRVWLVHRNSRPVQGQANNNIPLLWCATTRLRPSYRVKPVNTNQTMESQAPSYTGSLIHTGGTLMFQFAEDTWQRRL